MRFSIRLCSILLACGSFPAGIAIPKPDCSAAVAGEAETAASRELSELFAPVWPGWTSGAGHPVANGDPRAGGIPSALLGELLAERAGLPQKELDLALQAARSFDVWSRQRLPAPATFLDSELPAPQSWVARQLPLVESEEALSLIAVLTAGTDEQATQLAARLSRYRFRRIAMLRDRQVAELRSSELRQGLPVYAAYLALVLRPSAKQSGSTRLAPGDAPPSRVATRLRDTLQRELHRAATDDFGALTPEVSGFALALVLDRTRPGWQRLLVERQTSLDVLAAGPPARFGNQPSR